MTAAPLTHRVGDRVRHPVFGEGLVLEVVPRGDDTLLRISFGPPSGERRLSARAAPLEHLESAPPPVKSSAKSGAKASAKASKSRK